MNPIKPNIGTLDRYLRLSAGLIIFSSGITGRRSPLSRSVLTVLGAAKIAEGITGWCPLVALTTGSTVSSDQSAKKNDPQKGSHTNSRFESKESKEGDQSGTFSSLDEFEKLHSQHADSRHSQHPDSQPVVFQKQSSKQDAQNNSQDIFSDIEFSSALDELELYPAANDSADSQPERNTEGFLEDDFEENSQSSSED